MRKMLAVAVMLLTMAGAASAQGGGGGGGRMQMSPEQRDSASFAQLFDGITLSADLQAKAKDVIKNAREANTALDREAPDFRDKMMAANAKRSADLRALLTTDVDRAKLDSNAARGRGRRGGGH